MPGEAIMLQHTDITPMLTAKQQFHCASEPLFISSTGYINA
jgi:hypothetical protein